MLHIIIFICKISYSTVPCADFTRARERVMAPVCHEKEAPACLVYLRHAARPPTIGSTKKTSWNAISLAPAGLYLAQIFNELASLRCFFLRALERGD